MLKISPCSTPTAIRQPKSNVASKLIGIYNLEPWNLWNLCAEPLVGTLEQLYLEPSSGTFTWHCYLEPPNLLEPTLGTVEPPGSFSWNPLLGTLTWNLGTFSNLEPLLGTLEPSKTLPLLGTPSGTLTRNLPKPLLGTLTFLLFCFCGRLQVVTWLRGNELD